VTAEYRNAGKIVLYTKEALDAWALSKLGAPVLIPLDGAH